MKEFYIKSRKNNNNKLFIFLLIIFQLISISHFKKNVLLAQETIKNKDSLINKNEEKNNVSIKSEYLLGPGDVIYLDFLEASFLNGSYTIPLEGNINLPEIGKFNLDGKTISELEEELKNAYKDILYEPDVTINILSYRPINVYVKGEVSVPGLYEFAGISTQNSFKGENIGENTGSVESPNLSFTGVRLYSTIAKAGGVNNYANLSDVIIYRNYSKKKGGGKIKTSVNLLSLLETGDQSQNIRILDGDTIFIQRGDKMLKEQILTVNRSNISPSEISVFVTGNIESPGRHQLRQGTTLNQAIASSGGRKFFTGKINFIRFNADGSTTKESFKYDASARINTKKNPILMTGDIIDVNKNIIGKTNKVFSEITGPFVTSFGLYKIFQD